jgi:hypothetical protein
MACSFHHKEEFDPSKSSIRILNEEGKVPYRVWLIREGEENIIGGVPCDGCKNLEEPLCLQFCRKEEELEKILDEFKKLHCG